MHYIFNVAVRWSRRMIIYVAGYLWNESRNRSNKKVIKWELQVMKRSLLLGYSAGFYA